MFRFKGLSAAPFQPYHAMTDAELLARGARRMVADAKPGFPCRVSLEDAEPGERLVLLNFEHQPAHTPYRATGPIFVRETAGAAYDAVGEVPSSLRTRLLSLRAYDAEGVIVEAGVAPGAGIETLLQRLFARADTDVVHVHYASRGCYACKVERA
ncbi:MAG TPA: DUF1203 domain-containing protein [Rhizomicrobium sp.]|jgi:hypothetical protein|nr:DUF1203 domain-containing protein [Rhizomicrobium sp.]